MRESVRALSVCFLLRTALFPPRFTRGARARGVLTTHRERLKQYRLGLEDVGQVLNRLDSGVSVVLIDNTVPHPSGFPSNLWSLLPEAAVVGAVDLNATGAANKGAGDIEVWRHFGKFLASFDFVVQYNPRMRLIDPDGLRDLIVARTEIVGRDFRGGARTGYFSLRSDRLLDFAHNTDLDVMLKTNQSIEDLMEDFLIKTGVALTEITPLGLRFSGRSDPGHPY